MLKQLKKPSHLGAFAGGLIEIHVIGTGMVIGRFPSAFQRYLKVCMCLHHKGKDT